MKEAKRYNSDKPKVSLIRISALEPMARVLEFGRQKYSEFDQEGNMTYDARNNWDNGLVLSEVLDSMMRHIGDIQDGKFLDDDSGLPIIGHIQANAMFLGSKNLIDDISNDK